ncbi:hypothetical protein JCM10213v2_001710 [Rhodosporidiobolus nylandii]
MATHRITSLNQSASSSRLSLASDTSSAPFSRRHTPADALEGPRGTLEDGGAAGKYGTQLSLAVVVEDRLTPRSHPPSPRTVNSSAPSDAPPAISTVLAEPAPSASLLPSLPSLPSASSYLPSQLSSLSTTFTSAGTLPRSAAPSGKSVAQRRSQAPPIVVTELRKVNRSEFEGYLNEVGDEYERWETESRLAREGANLSDEEEGGDASTGLGIEGGKAARGGQKKPPKAEEVLPSLDDVPQIFFDQSFNLSNPRTFDLVTERIQLSPSPSPNLSAPSSATSASTPSLSIDAVPGLGPSTLTSLARDEALQEKLSHYTAVIESHLVREIGARSGAFFAALANLQSLHQEGEDTLRKIEELRGALGATETEGGVGGTAKHGLQILRAQARRRGLERIEEAVRAVEEIWAAVEGVKELVENGEWDGALEVSEGIEEAYYGSSTSTSSSPPPASPTRPSLAPASPSPSPSSTPASKRPRLNLTKLAALRSLPVKLSLLRAQIARSLEGELITVLEHEMDVGIEEHLRVSAAGGEWARAASSAAAGSAALAAPTSPSGLPGVPEAEDEGAEGEEEEERDPTPEEKARDRALERVRPVVRALVRAEGMDSAVAAWRESVLREVRALVREHLPTAGESVTAEDEDQFAHAAIRAVSKQSVDLGTISEKSLSLAKKLRALPHSAFLALAQQTYAGLLACIHVVDLQARVLLELSAQARAEEQARKARRRKAVGEPLQPPPSTTSSSTATLSLTVPGSLAPAPAPSSVPADARSVTTTSTDDAATLSNEISDVVSAVAELANVRFSKVIGVRTEVHASLSLRDFLAIFDATWAFVVRCEVVCQRMIVGLRGAMVSQAKAFLQQFHQRRITDSARTVEEEQWAAAEVPRQRQREVQCIVDAAMRDPVELLLGERREARLASAPSSTGGDEANGHTDGGAEADEQPAKQVDVEGRQFFAVSAGLTTIGVLVEYLMVLLNCPMLTTDCMSKIIEFMKAFNSRTCQVVLGAGAMRSAGLKNITAKHLALASQALSIMVSLIPYIRECVRRHLNPKQAVMLTEFDKLKRDYQEHQHEIHAKLVAIMSDRLVVHSRTMETINWEVPSAKPGAPNAYMESLVKEHLTLHKVLSRFLQPETVFQILGQVFTALDARLAEVLAPVELRSQDAKERLLLDVRYLREKLGDLKGLEGTGPAKDLESLVQSKPLPQPATTRPSLPPRTSSMAPSVSPFASPSPVPSPAGVEAPPIPATSLSLPSAEGTSTSPRTSLDAPPSPRQSSEPPSPVPVPQPLPPAPAHAGPAPYVSRKKTLAERLAERMGRKPAEAVPPQPEPGMAKEDALPEPPREETQEEPPVLPGVEVKRESVEIPTIVEPSASPVEEQHAPARPSTGDEPAAPPANDVTPSSDDAPAVPSSSSDHPTAAAAPLEPNGSSLPVPPSADPPLSTPGTELMQGLELDFGVAVTPTGDEPLGTPAREELENVQREVERELDVETAVEASEEEYVQADGAEGADSASADPADGDALPPSSEGIDTAPVVAGEAATTELEAASEESGPAVTNGQESPAPSPEQQPTMDEPSEQLSTAAEASDEPASPLGTDGDTAAPVAAADERLASDAEDAPTPTGPAAEVEAAQPAEAPSPPDSAPPADVSAPAAPPERSLTPPPLPQRATSPAPPATAAPVVTSPPLPDPPQSPSTPLSPTPSSKPQKKSLKERLAEAARKRGSLSGSMVEVVTSPPLAPTTPLTQADGGEKKEEKVGEEPLTKSPEVEKVELPPAVPLEEQTGEEGKGETTTPAPTEEAQVREEVPV